MSGPSVDTFLARHAKDEHPVLTTLRKLAAAGEEVTCEVSQGTFTRSFAETYAIRAEHLRQRATAHATQLRRGVVELVRAARENPGASFDWWTFASAGGRSLVFVERRGDRTLLAAMVMVSQLEVSRDDWSALWGHE